MADFEPAFAHLMEMEGGYVNDPDDPGGETNYGISKRSYPLLDIKNLTMLQAKYLYHKNWWLRLHCDKFLDQPLAVKFLSLAVTMGAGRCVRILQRAVNEIGDPLRIAEDGLIGPKTLAAVNLLCVQGQATELLDTFKKLAVQYYKSLNRPKFIKGWINRVNA